MQSVTLGELFSHPAFLWLSLTILATVVNVVIGINIHPQNKKHKDLHRRMYYVVLTGYLLFLAVNYSLHKNTWLEYSVFLYFLVMIPWTRGINITLHAVLSSVGLSLLVLVAALALF